MTTASRFDHVLKLEDTGLPAGDPALLYLESLAPGSRRAQWSAIRQVVLILSDGEIRDGIFPWEMLTPEKMVGVRKELIETRAPATGRRYMSALKACVEYTFVADLITAEYRDRLIHPRIMSPIRGGSPPPGRALDRSEAFAFLKKCAGEDCPSSKREAAIFAVMYCGGLRAREVINLDLEDVDFTTGRTRIHGKGAKNRDVVLPIDAVGLIERWLEVRGRKPGPLFVPLVRGAGVDELRRITYPTMRTSLGRRAEQAGVKRFTPHDLRRTFVSDLLTEGQRIEVVAHACGHANINTTARYEVQKDAEAERMTRGRRLPVGR